MFRTNHFWRFDQDSDEINPHNKNQEIPQQSLRVLTFFYRKHFLLQFLQSPGTCSIREQFKVILQIWWSRGNLFVVLLFWWAVNSQIWTVKYQRAFSRIVGFAGKRFLFSPPPPPSTVFFAPALTFAQQLDWKHLLRRLGHLLIIYYYPWISNKTKSIWSSSLSPKKRFIEQHYKLWTRHWWND